MNARPQLSIVIPFYNEEDTIELLKERLSGLNAMPDTWELVFVSDGTTDRSLAVVENWTLEESRVKLIVLSRNFGHQAAISAGIDHALGEYVGVMDADLQDPPESLMEMYRLATENNWDVVYAVRATRNESYAKRISYRTFYWLYGFLADSPVALHSGDFAVLSRRAVTILRSMPEKLRFIRGLRSWVGLRQLGYPLHRPERASGHSKYSFRKLVSLAVTGITSFSIKPLRLATLLGILLSTVSIIAAMVYVVIFLSTDLHERVPGFTTIVIVLLLLSGLQFLILGILGEYIGRIFWEVKQRPSYLIDRTVNCKDRT